MPTLRSVPSRTNVKEKIQSCRAARLWTIYWRCTRQATWLPRMMPTWCTFPCRGTNCLKNTAMRYGIKVSDATWSIIVVYNLAADILLRTSILYHCFCNIFPCEWKFFPWHWRPGVILSTHKTIKTIFTKSPNKRGEYDVYHRHDNGWASSVSCGLSNHNTCLFATEIFVRGHGAGLKTTATHRNVVQCRCSITTRGVMDILSRKPLHFYIMNLTSKLVNIPEFMIGSSASSPPEFIIHAGDDATCKMVTGGQSSAQGDVTNQVNVLFHKLLERRDNHLKRCKNVKKSDDNSRTDWWKDQTAPDDYFVFGEKFISMVEQFESIWDGHIGLIKAVPLQMDFSKTKCRPIHSASIELAQRWGNAKNNSLMGRLARTLSNHPKPNGHCRS